MGNRYPVNRISYKELLKRIRKKPKSEKTLASSNHIVSKSNRKLKMKKNDDDFSFYIPYLPDMKKNFIKISVKWLFFIFISWLGWFILFIYYPLTTMVDITGEVTDSRLYSLGGRGAAIRTYAIKLENDISPVRHKECISIFHWNSIPFGEIDKGDTLTVQIQRKDLDKLNNYVKFKPLLKYSKLEISKFPRFYGIKRHNEVIVSSAKSLWYAPPGLGILFQIICFLLTLIGFLAIYTDGKKLQKIIQWKNTNKDNYE